MLKIAWGSCERHTSLLYSADVMLAMGITDFYDLGDTPYIDQVNDEGSWGSGTLPAIDENSTQADYEAHYAKMAQNPAWSKLYSANIRRYKVPNDHEYWNGVDHSPTTNPLTLNNAAELTAQWDKGRGASDLHIAQYYDNPARSVAGTLPSWIAANAPATDASKYAPDCFRIAYNLNGSLNTSGAPHAVVYVLDVLSSRSPVADTDDASKTMLGATQKAWWKAQILADEQAGIPLKATMLGNRLYGADGNTDTYTAYSTERDELENYLDTNDIGGHLWCAGDQHRPHVAELAKSRGDAVDSLSVCACPLSVYLNASGQIYSGNQNVIWASSTPDGESDTCFGMIIAEETRWKVAIVGSNGRNLWGWQYVDAGSRKISKNPRHRK